MGLRGAFGVGLRGLPARGFGGFRSALRRRVECGFRSGVRGSFVAGLAPFRVLSISPRFCERVIAGLPPCSHGGLGRRDVVSRETVLFPTHRHAIGGVSPEVQGFRRSADYSTRASNLSMRACAPFAIALAADLTRTGPPLSSPIGCAQQRASAGRGGFAHRHTRSAFDSRAAVRTSMRSAIGDADPATVRVSSRSVHLPGMTGRMLSEGRAVRFNRAIGLPRVRVED